MDIVVPCYNSESTLKDCVDSIISQETDHSFRLILIDDGSKDGTGSIIDSYMQTVRRPEITAIHQQNKGHSGARNAGLDILNSKYVMFVDSDDKLYSPNSLQTLLDTAFSFDADIVEGGAYYMKNQQLKSKDLKPSGRIGVSDLRGMPWGKVIRSSFFGNIEFPENYWYEDSIMAQIIYPSADPEKICGVDEVVYYYNVNSESISVKSRKSNKSLDSLWVTFRLFDDR
ncbi:MAG: glycosyltransferase, partial [Clostridia bacterium]|nr:glycosyltransferase [Clostridia bacterium]